MPYILATRHIPDDQYLSHQLAMLAECAHVMPGNIVALTAIRLIGKRYDRAEWVEKFKTRLKEKSHDRT